MRSSRPTEKVRIMNRKLGNNMMGNVRMPFDVRQHVSSIPMSIDVKATAETSTEIAQESERLEPVTAREVNMAT